MTRTVVARWSFLLEEAPMPAVRLAICLLGVLAVSLPTVTRAPAGEKPNPIAAKVKASLKDSAKPFTLIVRLRVKDDAGDKLEAAFAKAAKATRKEKGCLAYDLNRDAKAPTQYLLYERWQNLDSLEAHLRAPHITALLAQLGDLLAGPPEAQVFLPAGD
jgi:quinol monooxygenase YgiN